MRSIHWEHQKTHIETFTYHVHELGNSSQPHFYLERKSICNGMVYALLTVKSNLIHCYEKQRRHVNFKKPDCT